MEKRLTAFYHCPIADSIRLEDVEEEAWCLFLEHAEANDAAIVAEYIDGETIHGPRTQLLNLVAEAAWDMERLWDMLLVYEPTRLFDDLELVGALLNLLEFHDAEVRFINCSEDEEKALKRGYESCDDPRLEELMEELIGAAATVSGFQDAVHKFLAASK